MDIEIDFNGAKLARQRPSRRRLDTCEVTADNQEFTDVESFNRVTHYYPAVDKIILELKTRFTENDSKGLCSLGKMMMPEFSKAMKIYSYNVNSLVVCFYVETSRG